MAATPWPTFIAKPIRGSLLILSKGGEGGKFPLQTKMEGQHSHPRWGKGQDMLENSGKPAYRGALAGLLAARATGVTLRQAAATAGVHVATVCRWQARDPVLREALAQAAKDGRQLRKPAPEPRPLVRWRRDCPVCRARVVVRTARGGVRFWRCGRWPRCEWASWRPRAPRDCPRCGGPRFWSHSRRSVGCDGCGLRTKRPLTGAQESHKMQRPA